MTTALAINSVSDTSGSTVDLALERLQTILPRLEIELLAAVREANERERASDPGWLKALFGP